PWRIGLRHPRREGAGSLMATAEVTDEALSTSGDYERFFEVEGVRYHHIIDPRTGYPAWCGKETAPASRPVSVLVVIEGGEPDCGMKSDLLTTALFVLGRDRGEALLSDWRDKGIEGLLVTEDGALHGTFAITDFKYL
ncbi:MAG: FAD:protein FMN transferase, partial [Selenomonas sp.]|nr:FAD:protein FMN transferase [Selenomonas sp.]